MSNDSELTIASIYPDDAIAQNHESSDVIDTDALRSIPELFRERVRRSPNKTAYLQFSSNKKQWLEYSWQSVSNSVDQWRRAFLAEQFVAGERVAIRKQNSVEWVMFDQAALAQGLVVVPVYTEDRSDNIAYILANTQSRLLLLESYEQWLEMKAESTALTNLKRVVIVGSTNDEVESEDDARVVTLHAWLQSGKESDPIDIMLDQDDLATIVYTSGTTGKPKGVMLSHGNLMLNAHGGLKSIMVFPHDRFLSFLPLSHMFERTVGYYLTMMSGAEVAFNRSIPQLLDDLAELKPTGMITVPRIFERAYGKIKTQLEEGPKIKKQLFDLAVEVGWQRFERRQGRADWQIKQCLWPILNFLVAKKVVQRFGGNLRLVVSGGARLGPNIARVFIGLGIEILQGYGLTETSPVLTVNTLKRNLPSSIGLPLRNAELRLKKNNELQARGPYVMQGYWNNPEATAATIDQEGWLMTGDIASISDDGYITITGRIKEIIVLTNGEKVPPADMESAICDDSLFEQAMVLGEGKSYLTALVVLNDDAWRSVAPSLGVDAKEQKSLESDSVKQFMINRIAQQLSEFPGYAFIRYITLSTEVWKIEDGSITPTLKLKRPVLIERFKTEIAKMYDSD